MRRLKHLTMVAGRWQRWMAGRAGLGADTTVRLRADRIVPIEQPLILISQIQRSGGTLLTRLLDHHDECFVHPYDFQWGPGPKGHWPALPADTPADAWLAEFRERWLISAVDRAAYWKGQNSAQDRHPFVFSHELRRDVFCRQFAARQPATRREVLNYHFTAFFNAWLDYQSMYRGTKRFVCGFSPRVQMTADALERFWADYPDGYLVSVIRDPSSWLASALRHKRHYQDVPAALELWAASARATLEAHARRPDRVCAVLFEDLVGKTELVMRRLCDVTSLTFRGSLLEPTFNGRPVRSNSQFAPAVGLDPSAIDRSALISAADAARISDDLRDLYSMARTRCRL